jgi:eukaryotic-like serine/threonine-protein kinase
MTKCFTTAFAPPVFVGRGPAKACRADRLCLVGRQARVHARRVAHPAASPYSYWFARAQGGLGDSAREEERGAFRAGDLIAGRYRVQGTLGRGSSGVTYDALDALDGDLPVAIKALSLRGMRSWKTLELLQREARALENLSHPGIPKYVDMLEVDTATDRVFVLVQRKAAGISLQELVDGGFHFSVAQITCLLRELLQVLNYLGTLNPPVLHRDVKPANIIINMDPQSETDLALSLVDFGGVNSGVSRLAGGSGAESPTNARGYFASTVVGTFGYMAPEQFAGRADVRSDLYAAAATVLFALTGRCPSDIPQKRLKLDIDAYLPRSRRDELGNVYTVIKKLLEPAPEDRYRNARVALDRLALRTRDRNDAAISATRRDYKDDTFADRDDDDDDDFGLGSMGGMLGMIGRGGRPRGSAASMSTAATSQIRHRKPAGTRVIADRDDSSRILRVFIPPRGFTSKTATSGVFALAWTGFVGFWTLGVLTGGAPIAASLFSLPFWFAGAKMAKRTVDDLGSTTELVVSMGENAERTSVFSLRVAGTLGDVREIDGDALDIQGARVVTSAYVNGEPVTGLVLDEGVRKHNFGEDLDITEQEWLCEEVNSFLVETRRGERR